MGEKIKTSWQKLDSALKPGPVLRSLLRSPSPLLVAKKKYRVSSQGSWERQRDLTRSPSPLKPAQSHSTPLLPRSLSRAQVRLKPLPSVTGLSNEAIERLYHEKCRDINIPILEEQMVRFYEFCQRNARNRRLFLEDCALGPGAGKVLGEVLLTNTEFVYLCLGRNPLGTQGAIAVLKTLNKAKYWVHLGLNNTDLGPDFLEDLATLGANESLASLDLSSQDGRYRNRLGAESGAVLGTVLRRNCVISVLNLAGSMLGQEGVEALAKGMTGNSSLIWLDLSSTGSTGKACEALGRAICSSKVRHLSLKDNKLGLVGAELVGKMAGGEWSVCPLKALDLTRCEIIVACLPKLLPGLTKNASIAKLWLNMNRLGTEYSVEIYQLLAENTVLQELGLRQCALRDEGLLAVAEGLGRNRSIVKLDLALNYFEDMGAAALATALAHNTFLRSLDLTSNRIKEEGGAALCAGLQANRTLATLQLKDNGLDDEAGKVLARIATRNRSLTTVGLQFNPVSVRLKREVGRSASTNRLRKQRSVTPLLRSSLKTMRVPPTAFADIDKEVDSRKLERTALESNLAAQTQRLSALRVEEEAKFGRLKLQLEEVKKVKLDRAVELREVQNQLKQERKQGEEEYRELEQSFFDLAGTTKRLEKELKRIRENYALKRSQATQQLVQAQENRAKEISYLQLAQFSLKTLQEQISAESPQESAPKTKRGRGKKQGVGRP